MIFITGDTHGFEFEKLNMKKFPIQKELNKNDYIIIAGDFGLVWDNSNQEKYWLDWLEHKKPTILFIDGNHENFNLLNTYPIENWKGGKIHKIRSNIYHLMRGQIFNIDNKKIFTFGGATSIDKKYRIENISWWKEEIPSVNEFKEALSNLKLNDYKVDYIITHTCSTKIINEINKYFPYDLESDIVNDYLERIAKITKYNKWYFGHFHEDINIDDKHFLLYNKIVKVEEE